MQAHRWLALLVAIALVSVGAAPTNPARISLELVTEPKTPATAPQQWLRIFSDLGVSGLRIRSARGQEKPEIEQLGSKAERSFRVVGVLKADNVLYLPSGKFTPQDSGKLRKWLDNLGDQGAEGVTQPRVAFGLVAGQLQLFQDDLKKPLAASTKGKPLGPIVEKLAARLAFPLTFDAAARPAMVDLNCADELQDMSRGTALAALLRPAGLAFEPQREAGGKMHYQVRAADAHRPAWPIGWKPYQPAPKVLPESFEPLNVELKDITAAEVLDAIQGRLKVPFLLDHNALAWQQIDPAKVEVNLPSRKLTYNLTLTKALAQARLKPELRVDDAERPFYWITTIKPAP